MRQKWWSAPLGHIVWALVTLTCATLRKKVVRDDGRDPATCGDVQCIVSLWHNRVLTPCYVYRYVLKAQVPMCVLTSASKDGAMLATVTRDYGMHAVRGSSARRGAVAFKDMLRVIKEGYSMTITPDGPKGPRYKCHPGIIKLAAMSGLPIIPLRIGFSSYWRIKKAWDGFIIPKPFSRIEIHWGHAMNVPPDLTPEQIHEYGEQLEKAMEGGEPDFAPFDAPPAEKES